MHVQHYVQVYERKVFKHRGENCTHVRREPCVVSSYAFLGLYQIGKDSIDGSLVAI